MNRLIAFMQLMLAAVLFILAVAALINLVFIAPRPETISVVNSLIALLLLAVCMLALARILFRKAMIGLRKRRQETGAASDNRSH